MREKYTMQDIANEAGVSKATVSYVLNDKPNTRVSEEMRKKILQIANVFNYVPNISAKNLGNADQKLIGIMFGYSHSDNYFAEDYAFIKKVQQCFSQMKYQFVLLENRAKYQYMDLAYDAIIAIDLSEEQIKTVTTNTFSPIVLVDCMHSDNLFFQVCFNYVKAVEEAKNSFINSEKTVLIYNEFSNEKMNENLENSFSGLKFSYSSKSSDKFAEFIKSNKDKDFIVIGKTLASFLYGQVEKEKLLVICNDEIHPLLSSLKSIEFSNAQKAKQVFEIIKLLAARKATKQDEHMIILDFVHKIVV